MEFLTKIKDLLISPRFMTFYWNTGTIALVGFLNLIVGNLEAFQLSATWVVIIGGVIGQITKALSNASKGEPMGFAK